MKYLVEIRVKNPTEENSGLVHSEPSQDMSHAFRTAAEMSEKIKLDKAHDHFVQICDGLSRDVIARF